MSVTYNVLGHGINVVYIHYVAHVCVSTQMFMKGAIKKCDVITEQR